MKRQCGGIAVIWLAALLLVTCDGGGMGNNRLAEYFAGTPLREPVEAIQKRDTNRLRRWLDGGGEARAAGNHGMTLLHWALLAEDLQGFQLLLARGADPNTRLEDGAALMPLAATHPDSSFLTLALRYGGDPNTTDGRGYTPLMRSITNRRDVNARLLLDAGAHVDAATPNGFTALTFAVGNDSKEQVVLLLRYGADPLAPGSDGINARKKADMGADPALQKLLDDELARRARTR
ncbi:MAG TPA: ankyrin repeat domain-containing protein [Burkholderiales bacterium]|nr:ankyrin repeat domain-containing protein [Burkholderiales bacterium]